MCYGDHGLCINTSQGQAFCKCNAAWVGEHCNISLAGAIVGFVLLGIIAGMGISFGMAALYFKLFGAQSLANKQETSVTIPEIEQGSYGKYK